MILNDGQQEALNELTAFITSDEQCFFLGGNAGAGKSMLLQYFFTRMYEMKTALTDLVPSFDPIYLTNVYFTATTRDACAVLAKDIDSLRSKVTTIYSLLSYTLRKNYTTGEEYLQKKKGGTPIPTSLIVIDEASYMSVDFFVEIMNDYPKCKFLLVGDPFQLTPVRETSVLTAWKKPQYILQEVMRNGGHILQNSIQFKDTVMNKVFTPIIFDNKTVWQLSGQEFSAKLKEVFMDTPNPEKAKVITWTNTDVTNINSAIRIDKGFDPSSTFEIGEVVYSNNHLITAEGIAVLAGELCVVDDIKPYVNEEYRLVRFANSTQYFRAIWDIQNHVTAMNTAKKTKQWRTFYDLRDGYLDLRAMYVGTIHKAQGRTYRDVFVNLQNIGKCNNADTVARLLYVAFSRATDNVYCYGTLPAKYGGLIK